MLANKLYKGATIGIINPSDAICNEDMEYIELSKNRLEDLGYKVKFANNTLNMTFGYSMSAKEKAEDIKQMFLDENIDAIFAMGGGESAFSCLQYVDFDVIRNNPKIFLGYSDIDMLNLAIYKKTELVTFNGITFKAGFSKRYDKYSEDEVINRLEKAEIGIVNKCSSWVSLKEGISEGILVGGNLSILTCLAGTEYFPDMNGKILFLEDLGFEASPANICRNAHILKYYGVFDKVKGILIGNYEHETGTKIEKVLMDEVLRDVNIPIVKCDDFGHGIHHTVLPNGVKVRLDGDNAALEFLEACVK